MNHKKKILLFISSLGSGGAQRQMVLLANELANSDNQVSLLVYHQHNQLLNQLDNRVNLVEILKKGKLDFIFIFRLWRYIKKYKPDTIISYLFVPNMYARTLGRLSGISKIITSERNIDLGHSPFRVMIERFLSSWGDIVVVNANEIKKTYSHEMYGLDPIVKVIYNAVNTEYFRKTLPIERSNNNSLRSSEIVLLVPARIEKQKNHRCLIEAVHMLPESIKFSISVIFAGNAFDNHLCASLNALIGRYHLADKIKMVGPQDNMPELYSSADIVVLPSLWEGFPNAVVEAMACEAVVIASDVSDNPEIISSGENGFIFCSNNALELKEQILNGLKLTVAERATMGAKARERVLCLCGRQRFREKYLALI